MRVIVYAAGAFALLYIALTITASLEVAQEGGSPEEIEAQMMSVPQVAKKGQVPVVVAPPHVSPKLLVGWIPRKLEKVDGRTQLVLEARYTLEPTEVEGRFRDEGCLEPEVISGRRWEIRCAKVGRLKDVRLRQAEDLHQAVLSWGKVE